MEPSFSLQTVFTIIKKWSRPIIAFVFLCTLAGALATFVLPKQYLSVATIVPSNPLLSDKTYLFGNNVQELNSVYGVEEDLDRLLATAQLNGNLNYLVDSFQLVPHYGLGSLTEKNKAAAFKKIKANSRIMKTETGSVKVYVWDTDKQMAARLANALVAKTEALNRFNNKKANMAYLEQLQKNITVQSKKYEALDTELKNMPPSAAFDLKDAERKSLLETIQQQLKLVNQLQTASDADNPGLVVLEDAYPSNTPDKPRFWFWLGAAFLGSTGFAILLAVILESFKKK
jgi:LPS O-antigen subunit length determinant protein (WzzB/FepE family)